jgi:hypothetical protein
MTCGICGSLSKQSGNVFLNNLMTYSLINQAEVIYQTPWGGLCLLSEKKALMRLFLSAILVITHLIRFERISPAIAYCELSLISSNYRYR